MCKQIEHRLRTSDFLTQAPISLLQRWPSCAEVMQTDVISATHENVLIPLAAQYNIVFSMYSYCASLQTFIMSCWWEPSGIFFRCFTVLLDRFALEGGEVHEEGWLW